MKCPEAQTPETQTKARGRPREFDPDCALGAALTVFWQHGYEGASMALLTEAMGITKPSLYACFGNKEALFKQALDLYERDKLAYINWALEAETARGVAERLLRGAVETHCGGQDPHGCMGVISMIGSKAEDASIRDHVIERRKSSEAAMIARFERAKAEGDLPPHIEPAVLVHYISTVIGGMQVRAQAGATREELNAIIDMMLTVWAEPQPA
ncbi:TetR/AcrR family transcriptional regulator [Croceicoccus sp. Ery15]|uniref:TetR/AcrR family transcriptional regulator n=1 Tax=Croceicoccus sp. Ery15 TaxID=1703338 RepID=UPI001E380FD2|nr:TetR/AcrR family transcriptional regulator [Croceicoccus sp. Ery15]